MARRKKSTAEGIAMKAEAQDAPEVSRDSVIEPFLTELSEKHAQFVRNFVSGQTQGKAYQGAYPDANEKTSAAAAHKLLAREEIADAVAACKNALSKKAEYGYEKAMLELEEGMRFSKATENATAYARCIELRSKLSGILVERHNVQTAQFSLTYGGIDYKGLAAPDVIEGEIAYDTPVDPESDPSTTACKPGLNEQQTVIMEDMLA